VVLAFGADVQVGQQIRLPDDLAAANALDPQALGAHTLLANTRHAPRMGAGLVLSAFTLEPGHSTSLAIVDSGQWLVNSEKPRVFNIPSLVAQMPFSR
jgi:hypothetical protein